jgi:hypothetical protein
VLCKAFVKERKGTTTVRTDQNAPDSWLEAEVASAYTKSCVYFALEAYSCARFTVQVGLYLLQAAPLGLGHQEEDEDKGPDSENSSGPDLSKAARLSLNPCL